MIKPAYKKPSRLYNFPSLFAPKRKKAANINIKPGFNIIVKQSLLMICSFFILYLVQAFI